MSKPLSKKQRQLQDEMTMHAANMVKFAALLVLRNQGWGAKRLTLFSDKFNEILMDINADRLTFSDLLTAIGDETGLNPKDFIVF